MENNKTDANVQGGSNAAKENSSFAMGIKLKLLIGFTIPLICTVVVGIVAYSLAASGMTANYEDSMTKAMSMAMEYLDFGFESAISQSEQLYYNTDLMRWATGAVYNEWTRKEIVENVSVDLNVKKQGNNFVANMYIIPGDSLSIISTFSEDTAVPGFYEALSEADESMCLETLSGNWIGSHKYVDSVLSEYYTGYGADSYACSYIRPMTTKRACIVVDYSSEAIADVLRNLDLGEKSISAFVTADGREMLLRGNEIVYGDEFSFVNQPYFTQAMAENAAMVIEYVKYGNQDYLFMVSKSYENGSAICAMVPVSMVSAGADSIKHITIFIVILSCVIALLAGMLIIVGISSTIMQISNKLKLVSGGDLTVTMNVNRRDEFKLLVRNIADMVGNSRNLIVQVLKTTENVSTSTVNLADASEVLSDSNNQIALAVDEIDKGLNRQTVDSQNCLALMDDLSQRITVAVDTVRNMTAITGDTKKIIADGMSTMDELMAKSQDTANITGNVTQNIINLERSLEEVEQFVDMINDIAEETSLLALNASIEAARAGEAGRGFAVVAQSVSKLSDGTIDAAQQIQSVMEQIRNSTNETVNVSENAGEIVRKQADTVNNTIHVFKSINNYLESFVAKLDSLEQTVEGMEHHRNSTLAAIENISSVSEQTSTSVSKVNDSLKHQMEMVGNLHDSSIELENRAKELTEAVNAFKI